MAQVELKDLKIEKMAPVKRRRTGNFFLFFLIIAVVFLAGWYYVKEASVATVEVAPVSLMYPSEAVTVLNASGYVTAQRKAAVASKITGRLVDIKVEEGSRIKKDDILAQLESEDTISQEVQARANLQASKHELDQADAELADAQLHLQRLKKLKEADYIAHADFDTAQARYKKALALKAAALARIRANEAALQTAEINVGYATIRAPFDAVVLTKNADVGDIVTPLGATANVKAAVVTVADLRSLLVEVDVSESNINKVKAGQPCEIILDAIADKRFGGKVHMIVPTAERTKGAITVKVDFTGMDPRILPEMSAKVAFLSKPLTPDDERARTVVHKEALVDRKGKKAAFRVDGDQVTEVLLRTDGAFGDLVEVADGLKAGDKVVAKNASTLHDGQKIRIKEK